MTFSLPSAAATAALALVFGFGGAAIWSWSGMADRETREYLLSNPEILPEMAEELQKREAQKRLTGIGSEVTTAFPGAVLGNPDGKTILVEFTDYGCTYCRQSVAEVEAMVAADPQLQVVIRELPIFEGSDVSARMALAAAKQGKFARFHTAMFAAGSTSPEAVNAVAQQVGLDMKAAQEFAQSREAEFELMKNHSFAQQLGIQGTPSWVAGGQIIYGAVGQDKLSAALSRQDK
ncbi:MAG: DsbA family protein [Sphingomonadaceae bacterium]